MQYLWAPPCPISVTKAQLRDIGNKIWKNEGNNSIELLTFWNRNEPFPSLGIGHCIWFPDDCVAPYTQTFPDLILFLKKQGVKLPDWLEGATVCPWRTRAEFYAPENKSRLIELQRVLSSTVDLQTQFMIDRLCNAFPVMLEEAGPAKRAHVCACFNAIAQSPNGLYALVDYVNFKGDGTNTKERYSGYGWGLLHVLVTMDNTNTNTLDAFVTSARVMLERRVAHAVHADVERRALSGWLNRINTYKP